MTNTVHAPASQLVGRGLTIELIVPDRHRDAVHTAVMAVLPLVPPKLRRIVVTHRDQGASSADHRCQCLPRAKYGIFAVHLFPAWYAQPPAERALDLVHELAHVYVHGLWEHCSQVIAHINDEQSRRLAEELLEQIGEEAVEDMAHLFYGLVDRGRAGATRAESSPADPPAGR